MKAARLSRISALFAVVLAAPLGGCKEDPQNVAPDLDGGGPAQLRCSVDDHNRPEKAQAITLGERFQDQTLICPPTDFDWFSLTIPPNSPLVTIDLSFDTGVTSAVDLAYDLYRADDTEIPIAGGRDENPGDNRSSVLRTHYLDGAGGQYFLKVRDVGDDDQDQRNQYALKVTAGTDPDGNEPNDDCASAKPLNGSLTGAIAADNDKDAFLLNIPAGVQIVDVHVTTTEASAIDFKASLFAPDGTTFLTKAEDSFGEDGPTDVHLRHGLVSTGGNYCLVIEDDDGVESSVEVIYTVTAQIVSETDPNEQSGRNDTPATAISLGSNGGTRTGIIGSKADLDWYRVDTTPGRVIEVSVTCSGCQIQPAIVYVYPHSGSPCTSQDQCDFLLEERSSCTLSTDCGSGVCRETPAGRRCAVSCEENITCPSFQCQVTGSISACTAVGACTAEGLCGVQQFARTGENGTVRTAQPAIAGTTYILVHDFEDNEFSTGNYDLNVRVVNDPDSNETNNYYVPYTTFEAGDIYRRSRSLATDLSWSNSGGRMVATGRGCISYEGDIDMYRLTGGNPCSLLTSTTGPSQDGDCGIQINYDRPQNSPLDLAYFLMNNGTGTRASFLQSEEGNETTFGDGSCGSGDDECMLYFERDSSDYYVIVRHFGQDAWSLDPAHCYNFSVVSATGFGCPASCPDKNATSGLCNCP